MSLNIEFPPLVSIKTKEKMLYPKSIAKINIVKPGLYSKGINLLNNTHILAKTKQLLITSTNRESYLLESTQTQANLMPTMNEMTRSTSQQKYLHTNVDVSPKSIWFNNNYSFKYENYSHHNNHTHLANTFVHKRRSVDPAKKVRKGTLADSNFQFNLITEKIK